MKEAKSPPKRLRHHRFTRGSVSSDPKSSWNPRLSNPPPAGDRSANILVVCGDHETSSRLSELLRSDGSEVTLLDSFADVLQMVEQNHPDLIFLELEASPD